MTNEIYEDIPQRIANIYNSCSAQEQSILRDILTELSETGESKTYNDVWLTDFKEIPVSIGEFLCSPQYLGETNRQGDSVYPFWKHTMTDIFSAGNKYNEIILSGATRIGKTSTAVSMLCYMLYLLMLYREPHEYFHKKEISKFSIVFANLTKDLAAGIAFREFNDTLKLSPWFNEHGTFTRSDRNFYYVPEGNNVEIIAVSDAAQALGRQVWACVVGDTKIITSDGVHSIQDLANKHITVKQYDFEHNQILYVPADVILTKYVTDTIRITMDDGTVIEGTPDHRIMLSDGRYIQLQSLTSGDVLMSSECNTKVQIVDFAHYGSPIPVYDVVNAGELHNFIVAGCTELVLHNCFIDEVNFAKSGVKDISKAKSHMKSLYDTVNARISGTFRLNGEVYGKLITASSKNTDSDFLSEHIETQLSSGNEHLYLVDRPQWEVLPPEMFSGDKFHFTVGDRYKRGFVVPEENDDEDHLQEYINQGYKVITAPAELRKNFIADYDISLRDIAGISVVGAMGFITQDIVTPCIATDRKNPFYNDVLEIGTRDNDTIESHFRVNEVPRRLMQCPMTIHCDLAEVNDLAGISGVVVDGSKVVETLEGKKVSFPFLRQIFVTGIKAPRGDRISFQKIINFIVWLRKSGFNILSVSTDQYQSSYFREMLNQQNFATEKISVDASLEPYIGLKSMMNDQRIELVKCQMQEDELVNLQRYNNRIDHKEGGALETGKDLSDALCGAAYNHIQLGTKASVRPKTVANAIAAINGINSRSSSKNPYGFNPFGDYRKY